MFGLTIQNYQRDALNIIYSSNIINSNNIRQILLLLIIFDE